MSRAHGIVFGAVATGALALGIACVACNTTNSCPPGARQVSVEPYAGAAVSKDFICLPPDDADVVVDDGGPDGAAVYGTNRAGGSIGGSTDAGVVDYDASIPDAAPDVVPMPVCTTPGSAGALDVHVLVETGATPAPPTGAVPDGVYVLAQATLRGTDGGAPAVTGLRAQIEIIGARVTLSAAKNEAVAGDSATATFVNGSLTTACVAGSAEAAAELFPPVGASSPAAIGWDGNVLTVVLHPASGDLELAFYRQ